MFGRWKTKKKEQLPTLAYCEIDLGNTNSNVHPLNLTLGFNDIDYTYNKGKASVHYRLRVKATDLGFRFENATLPINEWEFNSVQQRKQIISTMQIDGGAKTTTHTNKNKDTVDGNLKITINPSASASRTKSTEDQNASSHIDNTQTEQSYQTLQHAISPIQYDPTNPVWRLTCLTGQERLGLVLDNEKFAGVKAVDPDIPSWVSVYCKNFAVDFTMRTHTGEFALTDLNDKILSQQFIQKLLNENHKLESIEFGGKDER